MPKIVMIELATFLKKWRENFTFVSKHVQNLQARYNEVSSVLGASTTTLRIDILQVAPFISKDKENGGWQLTIESPAIPLNFLFLVSTLTNP